MRRLARIEHVKVVRLHTRIPAVDPDAITPDLVAALR
jgi:lysine 2,3-aminomutase